MALLTRSFLASPRLAGVVRHGALGFPRTCLWRRTSASSAAGRVRWQRVAAVVAAHVAPLIIARVERRREASAPPSSRATRQPGYSSLLNERRVLGAPHISLPRRIIDSSCLI